MNCLGTYVAELRVFRYCVRDQPSYQDVSGSFSFENYSKTVEEFSLFARLGRLRRVKVNAVVQNASTFALLGLVTTAAVEECFFDVFLTRTTISHGIITYSDYFRVIDAVVQIGSAPNTTTKFTEIAGLFWKAMGSAIVVGVRVWLDGYEV